MSQQFFTEDGSVMRKMIQVSTKTYQKIKSFQPNDLNDVEFLGKVSKALLVREENVKLVWESKSYEDYCMTLAEMREFIKEEKETEKKYKLGVTTKLLTEILECIKEQNRTFYDMSLALKEINNDGIVAHIKYPDNVDKFVTDLPTMKIIDSLSDIQTSLTEIANSIDRLEDSNER